MPSTRGNEWREGSAELYSIILLKLGQRDAEAAIRWSVEHEHWRPSPARLSEIAATLRGDGLQSDAEITAELLSAFRFYGKSGRYLEGSIAAYIDGEPPLSRFSSEVVRMLGGWERLCVEDQAGHVPIEKRIAQSAESIRRAATGGDARYTWLLGTSRQPTYAIAEDPRLPSAFLPVARSQDGIGAGKEQLQIEGEKPSVPPSEQITTLKKTIAWIGTGGRK